MRRIPLDRVCLSVISEAELRYGVVKSSAAEKNERVLNRFLAHVRLEPWDREAAIHYGDIRSELECQGRIIGCMDLMIAAHARSRAAILVTHNYREFQRVSNLEWEDWL